MHISVNLTFHFPASSLPIKLSRGRANSAYSFFLRFGAHHTQPPRGGGWQSGQCPLHTHISITRPLTRPSKTHAITIPEHGKKKKTLAQTEQQPHKRQKPIPIKREHNHKRDSVWESVEGTGERAHWLKWLHKSRLSHPIGDGDFRLLRSRIFAFFFTVCPTNAVPCVTARGAQVVGTYTHTHTGPQLPL